MGKSKFLKCKFDFLAVVGVCVLCLALRTEEALKCLLCLVRTLRWCWVSTQEVGGLVLNDAHNPVFGPRLIVFIEDLVVSSNRVPKYLGCGEAVR